MNAGGWKQWAWKVKREIYALYLAYQDPRVPWYARIFALCVVGYAFSPIDLIPDAIPVLGYLDDLILVPLGILLALKMIPQPVMVEYRERVETMNIQNKPANWFAGGVIIVIWLLAAGFGIYLFVQMVR